MIVIPSVVLFIAAGASGAFTFNPTVATRFRVQLGASSEAASFVGGDKEKSCIPEDEDEDGDSSLDKERLGRILSVISAMEGDLPPDQSVDGEAQATLSKDEDVPADLKIIQPRKNDRLRVVNGVASRTCPLNAVVAQLANCSFPEALELIEIGAVWARMEPLTEDEVLDQYYEDSPSTTSEYADLPRGWGSGNTEYAGKQEDSCEADDLDIYLEQMSSQRYRRILTPVVVQAGTDIRVYPNPRRFPACYEMTKEKQRLLYEDTTFLVVDKPPMLPTQPDTSNYLECCPGCVNDLMGPFTTIDGNPVHRPLLCHRVDNVVGGCVVLSKDRNGQRVFHNLQRKRQLKKVYLAVTTQPVPIGLHIHWMWAPQSARGKSGGPPCQLVSHTPPQSRKKARQYWIRCVLEVTNCVPVRVQKTDHYDPGDIIHYQSTIRLVTGRKHQVRAQLASLGAPIILDTLYEPIAGWTLDKIEPMEIDMDDAIAQCRIPTNPIGLQAHAIMFGGIKAKARTPWWGDDIMAGSMQR